MSALVWKIVRGHATTKGKNSMLVNEVTKNHYFELSNNYDLVLIGFPSGDDEIWIFSFALNCR